MLGTRLLVTAAAAPPVLLVAYLGGWPLTLLIVAAAILGTAEIRSLFRGAQLAACWPIAFAAAPLLAVSPLVPGLGQIVVVALVLAGLVWALYAPVEPGRAVVGWAATVAASLYLGLPLGLALALRLRDAGVGSGLALEPVDLPRGFFWLGLALGVTWGCDGAAYLVGRSLGRRPFFRRISPKKTLEGTSAGVVAALLVGLVLGPAVGLAPGLGAALGAVAGLAGVFGDLAESLLKRAGGVKDSGQLFPGHGGLLDRVDSLLFVFVVVYYGGALATWLQSLT